MKIRKLLNLPSLRQKAKLLNEINGILERCDVIAIREYDEQVENKRMLDGVCSKCNAKQDRIVDKISKVEGFGLVTGNHYLGFGSITGNVNIDTTSVNHCNECGHEWVKYKTKHISKTNIVRVALNYLAEIIDDPEHNTRKSWKVETIQVFDGFTAESIKYLCRKHTNYLKANTTSILSTSKLRERYKSIFD